MLTVAAPAAAVRDPAAAIDMLFATYGMPGSPGIAVGVFRDGQPLVLRGYGLANLEYPAPITTTTIFNTGSVSKQFTAFCIALLAREGKLKLDDDIRTYLPWMPRYPRPITIANLLHHTSGLRDYIALADLIGMDDGALVRQQQAMNLLARQRGLEFETGTRYAYSNSGYALLAEIVRVVSGQSLGAFAAARIFKPLGMAHTRVRDQLSEFVPNSASGYEPDQGGTWLRAVYNRETIGPGNVLSSVEDLAKWAENFLSPTVGDRALIDELTAPGLLSDGTSINYGFGLYKQRFAGHEAVTHTGEVPGFMAIVAVFPAERLSVVLLSNVPVELEELMDGVAAIFMGTDAMPPAARIVRLKPARLASLAGDFAGPSGNLLSLQVQNGTLRTMDASGNVLEDLEYRLDGAWGEHVGLMSMRPILEGRKLIGWTRTAGGVDGAGAPPRAYRRVDRVRPSVEELQSLCGNYYSEELDATYTLYLDGSRLAIRSVWYIEPQILTPTFADHFDGVEGSHADLTIGIERDAKGVVSGIVLHYPDADGIHLRRSVP